MAKKPLSKLELEEAIGKLNERVNLLSGQKKRSENALRLAKEESIRLTIGGSDQQRTIRLQQSRINDLEGTLGHIRDSRDEAVDRNLLFSEEKVELRKKLEEEKKERKETESQLKKELADEVERRNALIQATCNLAECLSNI